MQGPEDAVLLSPCGDHRDINFILVTESHSGLVICTDLQGCTHNVEMTMWGWGSGWFRCTLTLALSLQLKISMDQILSFSTNIGRCTLEFFNILCKLKLDVVAILNVLSFLF